MSEQKTAELLTNLLSTRAELLKLMSQKNYLYLPYGVKGEIEAALRDVKRLEQSMGEVKA